MGKRLEQVLHTKGYPNGQNTLKNVLNLISHKGNLNEDNTEVALHIPSNG